MGCRMRNVRGRGVGAVTALGVVIASVATLGAGVVTAGAASASVVIDAPTAPRAGTVTLNGRVGVDQGDVTTVLYVVDATQSTGSPQGSDCSGDGVLDGRDDPNGDGSVGDILDCEITGVEALNNSLATTTGLQVGLVGFANQAAAADLDPVGTAAFAPPKFTGGDARPRISTVARSVVRDQIGLYETKTLGGSGAGTAFNSAISVALSTLRTAPAGPKWIMFLSDGQAAIDKGLLAELGQSGVRLRSFGIGTEASCAPTGSLFKIASATGESCELAPNPASLAAGLIGSQPDAVNGVTVSIDDVSVAATLDAVGGWSADFTLGAGTYTAQAQAVLASGATQRTERTFTVEPAPGGPAPGTVTTGPGALKATAVKVTRPKPSRAVLPSRVTGRVGRIGDGLTVSAALSGSRVVLQGRQAAGAPWTTVAQDAVDGAGKFVLTWKPKVRLRLLRVELQPFGEFAASAAAVPAAAISACKVAKRGGGWTITCKTTAKKASVVRLLKNGKVTDRTRVRNGSLRLRGKGGVGEHTIDITVGKRRHLRLAL